MTDTQTESKYKAIKVQNTFEGEDCEINNEDCTMVIGIWTIERGSGYVTSCKCHAQELVDMRVEEGDLYPLPPEE